MEHVMDEINEATGVILDACAKKLALAKSDTVRAWCLHKLKHTFEVSNCMLDIMANDPVLAPLSKTDKRKGELAAILHDLGRFYQDGPCETPHGKVAADLLSNMGRLADPTILFAVGVHDTMSIDWMNPHYLSLPEDDKHTAKLLAECLRDADKLANIRSFCYHDIPDNIPPSSSLSSDMVAELKKGGSRPLPYSCVRNNIDEVVVVLVWCFDINFDYTKDAIRKLDYIQFGLDAMRSRGASDADLALVREYLKEFPG